MKNKTHVLTHQYSANIPDDKLFLSDEDSLLSTFKSYDMFIKNSLFNPVSGSQATDIVQSKMYFLAENTYATLAINYKTRKFDVELTTTNEFFFKNRGNIADLLEMTDLFFNRISEGREAHQSILIMDDYSDVELDYRENNIN